MKEVIVNTKLLSLGEKNLLLSEFMEGEIDGSFVYHEYIGDVFLGSTFHSSDLLYDSSWDWLMQVVQKIELCNWESNDVLATWTPQPFVFNISRCNTGIDLDGMFGSKNADKKHYNFYDFDWRASSRIEIVFNAVVQFIKWYNENKTK